MEEQKSLEIKVKAIKKKAERKKLPGRLERGYPPGLPAVFITSRAYEGLCDFAGSDTQYELGGVLVGKPGKSSRRTFVQIFDFIPATKGISRRASFEFTNEAQQHIHEVLQTKFKDFTIVGWFHTHPGYGVFLSGADQFIDKNYFAEKYHVAMVIDPTRSEVDTGVFVWNAENQRMRVPLHEVEG